MERSYLNITVPNIISVAVIAGVLWLAYTGLRMYVLKPKG